MGAEIIEAVEGAVLAHGEGRAIVEPILRKAEQADAGTMLRYR